MIDTCTDICCSPEAITLDWDGRLAWMMLFAQDAEGSLAKRRFAWLCLQGLRGRVPCPPMPDDPQPHFWPSFKPPAPKPRFDSHSSVQRIKREWSTLTLAETLTRLYGAGDVRSGQCPLHGEREGRAFVVWVSEDRWKCFGKCGTGGDQYDLWKAARQRGLI